MVREVTGRYSIIIGRSSAPANGETCLIQVGMHQAGRRAGVVRDVRYQGRISPIGTNVGATLLDMAAHGWQSGGIPVELDSDRSNRPDVVHLVQPVLHFVPLDDDNFRPTVSVGASRLTATACC
jgi:hypothetical protein